MKKISIICALALSSLSVLADNNTVSRQLNYVPDGQDFVCVNGNNRYTRALYGSHTAWRLETSDRPIFATYGKNAHNRNIRFRLSCNGQTIQLDSTDYCEARYRAGRRDYVVTDKRWNGAKLHISALAYGDKEGAIFQVQGTGFNVQGSTLQGLICPSKMQKFIRYGDLGSFEPADKFEPATGNKELYTVTVPISDKPIYFSVEGDTLIALPLSKGERLNREAEAYRNSLASSVTFTTPDPFINPIGGAMVLAMDGTWDGVCWNHGAVGWRMQLPGWRAAYAGDFLGMFDRQHTHFDAYANSQVTDVPVTLGHLMDESNNLARGTYKWGSPMYSNGYICRNPNRNNQFHHYDMNLVYIDELLWHFQFDADTTYMRKMWPVIKSSLAWEKNTWDPDGDHLYDAYCCIWASDALEYNSGAVTHSSAYNYRANRLAARICEILGEDPEPYRKEADAILAAMNSRLWTGDHWAEYQDFMGLKRVHPDAAVWSIYTPLDSWSCTGKQAYDATRYIDQCIPHINFNVNTPSSLIPHPSSFTTISTSNWCPYEWSINNVAMAEVMHTALAYYEAGRADAAYKLLKGTVMDFMYCGQSPANFGQLSVFDKATGACYRDFADVTGISSRTFIQGLFGITPEALEGKCIIRPGFPTDWTTASIHTPYMDYSFERKDGKDIFHVKQNFPHPLKIVIRQNLGGGEYKDTEFSNALDQTIEVPTVLPAKEESSESTATPNCLATLNSKLSTLKPVKLAEAFNASVSDIFKQKYLTPRSPYTTLCIPTQGIGDWCSTKRNVNINDSVFRQKAEGGVFKANLSDENVEVPFATPQQGKNIIYTSLWDNYPDSVTVRLKGKGSMLYLLMAGSTNPMQTHIANGVIRVTYTDGTTDSMELVNPYNWCPIEQDYYHNAWAFPLKQPLPYRVGFASGVVSRDLSAALHTAKDPSQGSDVIKDKPTMYIDGGAGQILQMPINPQKKMKSLTLRTLSNDVVIGLMAVTIAQ